MCLYVVIAAACWVGFTAGTYMRRWANTDAIIRLLLLLVFTSSGILLGALDDVRVAIGFGIGLVLWLAWLVALAWRPAPVGRCLTATWSMGQRGWAALCSGPSCSGDDGGRSGGTAVTPPSAASCEAVAATPTGGASPSSAATMALLQPVEPTQSAPAPLTAT